MKKLTLDETWRLCLSMWRWIAKEVRQDRFEDAYVAATDDLKAKWLKNHNFSEDDIEDDCFFCNYAKCNCKLCPAAKIEKNFCCTARPHDYADCPIKFYNKLVSLNRKRKKGK